jgi:hypothetical protein
MFRCSCEWTGADLGPHEDTPHGRLVMLLPPMGQQPKQAHWEARADASYHPKSLKAKRGNGVGSKSRERVLEIASHTLSKVSCLGFWGLGFSCLYAPLLCLRRGPRGARVEVLRLECRSIGASARGSRFINFGPEPVSCATFVDQVYCFRSGPSPGSGSGACELRWRRGSSGRGSRFMLVDL